MGLLLIVVVHIASIQDRDGAKLVSEKVAKGFPRLKLSWADGGYGGKLMGWVKDTCQCILEIVKRNDDIKGFKVLPHRWVVDVGRLEQRRVGKAKPGRVRNRPLRVRLGQPDGPLSQRKAQ